MSDLTQDQDPATPGKASDRGRAASLSDEPSETGAADTPETRYVKRKDAAKEKARLYRKEAYRKAKARYDETKAQRVEQQNTPEANERKLRLRALRREAYLKAKDAHKLRVAERKATEKRLVEEEKALRDEDVLRTLVTADKLATRPPKLRLVKPGDKS